MLGRDLLADECLRLHSLAQAKNLWLKVEPPAPRISLRTDRVKLARVLGNLLTNAIKFTESGGVTVSSTVIPARGVLIDVSDTGIGIAPENLAQVFDEFAQVDSAARGPSKGWGLGLAIGRRLIAALGGQITVRSELNHGSTFTISLPASHIVCGPDSAPEPCAGQAAEVNTDRATLAGLHVLVVEDDLPTRESVTHILGDEGAVVEAVAEGGTARQLLQEKSYDAALLDMVLPDLDGREILKGLAAGLAGRGCHDGRHDDRARDGGAATRR